eukprot:Clim_evm73s236 gene=Clim_evmTU73s236
MSAGLNRLMPRSWASVQAGSTRRFYSNARSNFVNKRVSLIYEWNDQVNVRGESNGQNLQEEEALAGPFEFIAFPALSTISTHTEMRPLTSLLASKLPGLRFLTIDWPAFGSSEFKMPDRTATKDYFTPATYSDFMADILSDSSVATDQVNLILGGHSWTFFAKALMNDPELHNKVNEVYLLSPTYQAPLVVASGSSDSMLSRVFRGSLRSSIMGPLLWKMFTSKKFLRKNMNAHVYTKQETTERVLQEKEATTEHTRLVVGSYVSGELDAIKTPEDLHNLQHVLVDLDPKPRILYGEATPHKSMAKIQRLAQRISNKSITKECPGALLFYEEFPDAVASWIADDYNTYCTAGQ